MINLNEPCLKSADSLTAQYGKKTISIQLKTPIDVLEKASISQPLSNHDIMSKLENDSIYSEPFSKMIDDAKRILIILPDITRKSGAEYFLTDIIEKIKISGKDFSFIFATGTHRSMSAEEKEQILTSELYEKYADRIIDHDPDDLENHMFFGKTRRNTPIFINKAYKEHDFIVTLAAVSYHYFAGFGGGRKMIIPGIAARKTAIFNHKLVLDAYQKRKHPAAITGNLKGNPVHDDIVEMLMIARAHCNYYAINTLLNDEGKVTDVIGGDLFMAHKEATVKLKELTAIPLTEKYDTAIVSCGGYPKDINMVQAQKSLDRATLAVKDGGKIIFIAENPDGYGNQHFEAFFDHPSASEMFVSLMNDYQINRQTAFNLKNNNEKFDVYIVSKFPEEDVKRMGFTSITPDKIQSLIGDNDKAAFIPHAYNAFFEVNTKK